MNNKAWGFCGLIGAPWLYLGLTLEDKYPSLKGTWFTGAWEILYITGWMCSMIALQRLKITGESRFGKIIMRVLLACLTLANLSNVLLLFIQTNQPAWWFYLDLFWPISNLIMLVVGIVTVKASILRGWRRWIPLFVGMWFPLAALSFKLGPAASFILGGVYSAAAWSALAIMVITLKEDRTPVYNKRFVTELS